LGKAGMPAVCPHSRSTQLFLCPHALTLIPLVSCLRVACVHEQIRGHVCHSPLLLPSPFTPPKPLPLCVIHTRHHLPGYTQSAKVPVCIHADKQKTTPSCPGATYLHHYRNTSPYPTIPLSSPLSTSCTPFLSTLPGAVPLTSLRLFPLCPFPVSTAGLACLLGCTGEPHQTGKRSTGPPHYTRPPHSAL
jgi:hypothetical protein